MLVGVRAAGHCVIVAPVLTRLPTPRGITPRAACDPPRAAVLIRYQGTKPNDDPPINYQIGFIRSRRISTYETPDRRHPRRCRQVQPLCWPVELLEARLCGLTTKRTSTF
jgi:hypothetical protein